MSRNNQRNIQFHLSLLFFALLIASSPTSSDEFKDDFNSETINTENWSVHTHANDGHLFIEKIGNDGALVSAVDFSALDKDIDETFVDECCKKKPQSSTTGIEPGSVSKLTELLGLNINRHLGMSDAMCRPGDFSGDYVSCEEVVSKGAYPGCIVEENKSTELTQREEVQLGKKLWPPIEVGHWWRTKFKVTSHNGENFKCYKGSSRWIVGQWKFHAMACLETDSPLLALRFDNGVFHITVQDEDCNCVIAKTNGDFDALGAKTLSGITSTSPAFDHKVPFIRCESYAKETEGKVCKPKHLVAYSPVSGAVPPLSDPSKGWVDMQYYIMGGSKEQPATVIEVYESGRPIVKVMGNLVYNDSTDRSECEPLKVGNRIRMKFGNYRARVPIAAKAHMTDFCVSDKREFCNAPE